MQSKDDVEQSLVDAVIITNFNSQAIKLIAFDFSLNCARAIDDFRSTSTRDLKNIAINEEVEELLLNQDFVSRFTYSSESNNGVDQEIVLTLPLESAISFLEDYRDAFESNTFPF